jgi:hypothetical protein
MAISSSTDMRVIAVAGTTAAAISNVTIARREPHTRGDGAAGMSSGRLRRKRAYAAVNSTPYIRMIEETYTHSRKTTTAAIEPWIMVMLLLRAIYQANPLKAVRQRRPVSAAPTQTSRNRVLAFGMK